ncbi:hypothetical protein, partial [Georgenia sp.]
MTRHRLAPAAAALALGATTLVASPALAGTEVAGTGNAYHLAVDDGAHLVVFGSPGDRALVG